MIIVRKWIKVLSNPVVGIDEEVRVRDDGRRFYKVMFKQDDEENVIDLTATFNLAADKVEALEKPTDIIGMKIRFWDFIDE